MICDCQVDGFCARYQRDMAGRLRQICRGENISPAKAEVYRANWRSLVPIETQTTCAYLGDATGRTIKCGSCKGGVKIKVFECGKLGECTISKATEGLPTCAGCQHAIPRSTTGGTLLKRFDEHTLAPGGKGKRFNASLIEDPTTPGGYLLAYRDGWAGSDIHLHRLASDLSPVGGPWRLELRHSKAAYGREDPRLFIHNDRVHVAYIGVVGGRKVRTNVLYARLTEDLRVEQAFYPHLAGRNAWEKNHSPVSCGGNLYAIYSIAPHRIIQWDGDSARHAFQTPNHMKWQGGEMRGGAAPILVGNHYWHFFHDRIEVAGVRTYRTGVYEFESAPPFRITRYIPEPIMVAKPGTRPEGQYCDCVFTCGVVLRERDFVTSSGIHDRHTELHRFSRDELENQMVPVPVN